jgi:hypothetical protein
MVAYYYLLKGGENPPLQPSHEKSLALVLKERHHHYSQAYTLGRRQGRQPVKAGRSWGLYSKFKTVSVFKNKTWFGKKGNLGHVCLGRKQEISQVCHQVSPLASQQSRRFNMLSRGDFPMLCQSPLENHPSLASQAVEATKDGLLVNSTLLGFSHVVAPFGKNAGPKDKGIFNRPFSGYVQKLLRGRDAPPPRWHLLSVILSGRYYKEGKFRLKVSRLT